MVTKAYIQEVLTPYSVRVRIPLYHKINNVSGAISDTLLPVAYLCTPPNIKVDPKVNDVVIVTFEEDDLSKPIVIGYLYSSKSFKSTINIECETLTTTEETILSKDTQIGDIKYENLVCLQNQKENIPDTLKSINSSISHLKNELATTNNNVRSNTNTFDGFKDSINDSLEKLQDRVLHLEETIATLDDYLKKYPTILGSGTYGNTLPNTAENGQIYFTIKQDVK